MPFCPNCRYEYVVAARRCPKCDVPLVADLPAQERRQFGFEPLERAVKWLASRIALAPWVNTARDDLRSFPRFAGRGIVTVFRHPVLYLLPLLMFAGAQFDLYLTARAVERSRAYADSAAIPPVREPGSLREIAWQRVSSLPSFFGRAIAEGWIGRAARDPLPSVPVPQSRQRAYFETRTDREPAWYEAHIWIAVYLAVVLILTAPFDSAMYARLKSLTLGERPLSFLAGLERYLYPIAGVLVLRYILLLGVIFAAETDGLVPVARAIRAILVIMLFMFAPYAVVVHDVGVRQAIKAAGRFAIRHLLGVACILVGVTFAEWAIGQVAAPTYVRYDVLTMLYSIPVHLLLMLLGLCVWGMMMQWYVEATCAERADTDSVTAENAVTAPS
ncbi:MAG: hypothetical protein JSV65_12405 [Armatimonadota bacterium]|nr:MAG: hypothetical protein JSV65_12405 [Armatimonadota bacterium]